MVILKNKDLIIRNYAKSDIDDDIRWLNETNDWILLDTPWTKIEKVDPNTFRNETLAFIDSVDEQQMQNRYEIDVCEKHVGFLTVYSLEEDMNKIAIGIEICEKDYRNKGYGKLALGLFLNFLHKNGLDKVYIETYSHNLAMISCAKKVGFNVTFFGNGSYEFNGNKSSRILMVHLADN